MRLLAASVAFAIVLPLVLSPSHQDTGLGFWAIYINPSYRLAEFVAGIALAGLLRAGVRIRVPVAVAMLLAAEAYVLVNAVPMYASRVAVTIIPFCLLIFVCAQADVSGKWTGLRHRRLIKLGQWSFAFYLVHQLVLRVLEIHVPAPLDSSSGRLALALLGYAAATAIAYALFRLVEEPWERRIRRGRRVALPATATLGAHARELCAANGDGALWPIPRRDVDVGQRERPARPQAARLDAVRLARGHAQEVAAQVDDDPVALALVHHGVPGGGVDAGRERAAVQVLGLVAADGECRRVQAQHGGAVLEAVQREADGGVQPGRREREQLGLGHAPTAAARAPAGAGRA